MGKASGRGKVGVRRAVAVVGALSRRNFSAPASSQELQQMQNFERKSGREGKQVREPGLSEVGDQGRRRPMSSYFAEAEDSLLRAQSRVVPQDDCNPSPALQSRAAGLMRHS